MVNLVWDAKRCEDGMGCNMPCKSVFEYKDTRYTNFGISHRELNVNYKF